MALKNILLFAAAASAHFGLKYPEWRADTLTADEELGYDQWTYPCKSPSLSLSPLSPSTTTNPLFGQTPADIPTQAPTSPKTPATAPTGPSPAAPSPSTCTTPGPTSMSTSASAKTSQTSTSPSLPVSGTPPARAPSASPSSPSTSPTRGTAPTPRCRS